MKNSNPQLPDAQGRNRHRYVAAGRFAFRASVRVDDSRVVVFTPGSGTEFGGSLRAKIIIDPLERSNLTAAVDKCQISSECWPLLLGFDPFKLPAATGRLSNETTTLGDQIEVVPLANPVNPFNRSTTFTVRRHRVLV